ncbi:CheY chemotaxis protein or a CheY-like REC (receiver) domain [Sphingomonas sp. NFR04]|uniref:response regulator n=1 Tax=Sphingomonas sp. NFR04 TaxID=1566283 RepID=UPI0008E34DFB|nr:response regulator [Sphingomonas sp. NFR04]SFK51310.1 CheY chemotaxis protein or a CheY-like REC (receiver) domain [Sphingomonas sp. NFR04]
MKSVLIVEDEIFIAMEIERVLQDAGYTVVAIAADQTEALAAAAAAEVAFVDLNLRDGPTGPRLAQELADRFSLRIVYVTANPSQIEQPAPTAIGYIRKPFSEEAILAAAAIAAEPESAQLIHQDIVIL